jgi:hypothetical protein
MKETYPTRTSQGAPGCYKRRAEITPDGLMASCQDAFSRRSDVVATASVLGARPPVERGAEERYWSDA